ncbi:MAG: hypothetical protein K6T99_08680 [Armatimonadetes bacterium]|nr:hypothetical protein [Armatimonadota bacterium]
MKYILPLLILSILLLPSTSIFCATEYVLIPANSETGTTYTNPVWSPDGRSIAYVAITPRLDSSEPPAKSIYVATLTKGRWSHRLIAKDADWPMWSPDGKKLAFYQNGLAIMTLTEGKTNVVLKQNPDGGVFFPQSWSPNGRYIVMLPTTPQERKPFVFDIKSGKNLGLAAGLSTTWISDSKLLSSFFGEQAPEANWVRITDPTTGNYRTLLKDIGAAKILVPPRAGYAWLWIKNQAPKGEGLYRIDLKSGSLTKMVSCRAEELSWSPDGKQFAFLGKLVEKSGMEPQYNLYVGNTQNWNFKIYSKGAAKPTGNFEDHLRYISWSPDSKSIAFVTGTGDIKVLKL